MRIATYNINDVRKRIDALRAWLDVTAPDVVCLQELKCTEAAFPRDAIRAMGYEALVLGQKGWNGVAILAKGAAPLEIRRGLPGDPIDKEARYIEAAVDGMVIGCCYMPNGNPQPGPKFAHKLDWFKRFNAHAASLMASGHPTVLAGDYNVVPTDADIYATRSFKDNALLQPEPRAAYQALLDAGWTDALHRQSPGAPLYTFWSYLRNRWPTISLSRVTKLVLSGLDAQNWAVTGFDGPLFLSAVVSVLHRPVESAVWIEHKDRGAAMPAVV